MKHKRKTHKGPRKEKRSLKSRTPTRSKRRKQRRKRRKHRTKRLTGGAGSEPGLDRPPAYAPGAYAPGAYAPGADPPGARPTHNLRVQGAEKDTGSGGSGWENAWDATKRGARHAARSMKEVSKQRATRQFNQLSRSPNKYKNERSVHQYEVEQKLDEVITPRLHTQTAGGFFEELNMHISKYWKARMGNATYDTLDHRGKEAIWSLDFTPFGEAFDTLAKYERNNMKGRGWRVTYTSVYEDYKQKFEKHIKERIKLKFKLHQLDEYKKSLESQARRLEAENKTDRALTLYQEARGILEKYQDTRKLLKLGYNDGSSLDIDDKIAKLTENSAEEKEEKAKEEAKAAKEAAKEEAEEAVAAAPTVKFKWNEADKSIIVVVSGKESFILKENDIMSYRSKDGTKKYIKITRFRFSRAPAVELSPPKGIFFKLCRLSERTGEWGWSRGRYEIKRDDYRLYTDLKKENLDEKQAANKAEAEAAQAATTEAAQAATTEAAQAATTEPAAKAKQATETAAAGPAAPAPSAVAPAAATTAVAPAAATTAAAAASATPAATKEEQKEEVAKAVAIAVKEILEYFETFAKTQTE